MAFYIGVSMFVAPFVGLFILIWRLSGIRVACGIYGAIGCFLAWIFGAAYLIVSGGG